MGTGRENDEPGGAGGSEGAAVAAAGPARAAAEVELSRLRALLARRESLLRAAARALRRYNPADRIAKNIDGEIGDDCSP